MLLFIPPCSSGLLQSLFGWLFRMALNLIKGDHKERSIAGMTYRNGMINRLTAVFQFCRVWVDVCWLICSNWRLKVVKTADCCHFALGSLHLLCLKVVKTAITTAILCWAVCICCVWKLWKRLWPLPFCVGQFASVELCTRPVCVVEVVSMSWASLFSIFFSKEWTNMAVLAWAQISGWPAA